MLTYVGIMQLIKSVTFALMNYWLRCFPFPKSVIHKIESICRIFLWTCCFEGSRKAPVAWKKVCTPKSYGALNIIDIELWKSIFSLGRMDSSTLLEEQTTNGNRDQTELLLDHEGGPRQKKLCQ